MTHGENSVGTQPDVEITTTMAAELAGVNVKTIHRWIEGGQITSRDLPAGKYVRHMVSRNSLLAHLAQQKERDQSSN